MSTTYEQLQAIGKSASDSIVEMVAALECDYDRLEELREELKTLELSLKDAVKTRDNPNELESEAEHADAELSEFVREAKDSLASWHIDNDEELVELEAAAGDCESRGDAWTRIQEDPLKIALSGEWSPGETPRVDKAYILLGTGGPATRIVCELDVTMEPHRAYIQAQDWGTPWTDCLGVIDQDTLLTYCQQFYFGEG
jgi:hypothetical protein